MSERNVGRPWNAHEDKLLTEAVAIHGDTDQWKTIALAVPGRTNKACRKRWKHSLCPTVKKSSWTPEEDQLLLSLYVIHSTKWSVIARHISGRTDDACSKRYREALDPELKKDEWTAQEDVRLLDAYTRLGGKWGKVGQELKRSGLGCRNRWRLLERKRVIAMRQEQMNPTLSGAIVDPLLLRGDSWPPMSALDNMSYWDTHAPLYESSDMMNNATFSSPHASSGISLPIENHLDSPPEVDSQSRSRTPLLPFQYTSSSLSAALSTLQAQPNPSTSRLRTPQVENCRTDLGVPSHMGINESLPEAEVCPIHHEADSLEQGVMYSQESTTSYSPAVLDTHLSRAHDNHIQNVQAIDSSTLSLAISAASTASRPAKMLASGGSSADTASRKRPRITFNPSHHQSSNHDRNWLPRKGRSGSPPRLSSRLPVAGDTSILAYACGHPDCWPASSTAGDIRYATSHELGEHHRSEHEDTATVERPFRCGLAGCGKGWKSINGLQYHLQISKAHFQQAMAASCSVLAVHSSPLAAGHQSSKPKKTHRCPHPQCLNEYKQLSGLRYHLSHGHAHAPPTQLQVVPPALARKLAQRTQQASQV